MTAAATSATSRGGRHGHKSTAAILAILARYRVPATFFNIGQNMPVRPSPVRAAAGQAAETIRPALSSGPSPHRAVRVPAAVRGLRHDASARAAAPNGRVATVGRHPGLDGERVWLVLLGHPHHPAGRAGGWRPASSDRADAQPARRQLGDGQRSASDHSVLPVARRLRFITL
jgi:hypothetical protein